MGWDGMDDGKGRREGGRRLNLSGGAGMAKERRAGNQGKEGATVGTVV